MPAQGKELWVMVTICLLVVVGEVAVSPPIGWQLYVVLFQIFVTVIGAAIVWRYGTKGIVEAASRLRDATRIWDEPSIPKTGQPNVQSVSRDHTLGIELGVLEHIESSELNQNILHSKEEDEGATRPSCEISSTR